MFEFDAVCIRQLVASGLIFQSVTHLIDASRWVQHIYQVIDTIHLTVTSFFQARSSDRSYFATHDKALLAPYAWESRRIYGYVAELRTLSADNPEQQKRVEKLDGAVGLQFSRMNTVIAGAAAGKMETADQLIADKSERLNAQRIISIAKEMKTKSGGY